MTESQNTRNRTEQNSTNEHTISRRGLIKTTGAAAGAATVGGGSAVMDAGPVGRADAYTAVMPSTEVVGALDASVDWLLDSVSALASDAPSSGLSASELKLQIEQTARTRKSTNASMFIDNKNIIKAGAENAAYSEGKLAAIKALNQGKSKSSVKTAGTSAVDAYHTTVKKNFLKSWNESAAELETMRANAASHSSVTLDNIIFAKYSMGDSVSKVKPVTETTTTLPDGSSMTIKQINIYYAISSSNYTGIYEPTGESGVDSAVGTILIDPNGDNISYLSESEWQAVNTKIDTAFTNARDGLLIWVDNIYNKVQSGELDPAQLFSARELAALNAGKDNSFDRAITDLMALNVDTNLSREATITVPSTGATISGQMFVAGTSGGTTLKSGTTITPSSDSLNYYIAYDASELSGTWTAYDSKSGVDGGVVTFTKEPFANVAYKITTTKNETATIKSRNIVQNSTGNWEANISAQLDDDVADVDKITYQSVIDETKFQTVQLKSKFKIKKFVNENTGKTVSNATVDPPTDPQTDSNYITKKEWKAYRKKQQKLIEKYQNAKSGGLAGIFAGGSLPSWAPAGAIAVVIAYVLGESIQD